MIFKYDILKNLNKLIIILNINFKCIKNKLSYLIKKIIRLGY